MVSMVRFPNRTEAGRELAKLLRVSSHDSNSIVLALPRGGVPVAYEIATALGLPLDVCLVRKLSIPKRPELAIGAIAPHGIRILNASMIDDLKVSDRQIELITAQERDALLEREQLYAQVRPYLDLSQKPILLVDDGLATGATMQAAITFLRKQNSDPIVVAVPVASISTIKEIEAEVDQVICPLQPQHLLSVGYWYDNFTQISDAEVLNTLAKIKYDC